ncbi:MAG: Small protein from certain CxC ATPase-based modification system [Blastocatellia bacterium]|jgi:hypothetical protein|nr:Small protein from certain CxC ATPase-based modification system [Blastocatellia bacterium]
MGLDPKITEAVEAATAEAGQSPALARRLVAWLEAVSSGNEDVNNTAEADRHLEVLYEETSIPGAADEGGDA